MARVLSAVYLLEAVQRQGQVMVTSIERRGTAFEVAVSDGSRIPIDANITAPELFVALKRDHKLLREPLDQANSILYTTTVRGQWVELLYDLALSESSLSSSGYALDYVSVEKVEAEAIVRVESETRWLTYVVSLEEDVPPRAVGVEIASSFAADSSPLLR